MRPAGLFVKSRLCDHHAEVVIARERKRGFEIFERRDFFR
jgi:hypothetical protein